MKKLKVFVIVLVLIVSTLQSVYADEPIKINVDDKALGLDTAPELSSGRVMVPVRPILEALGMTLDYDRENRVITASSPGCTVIIPLDSTIAFVNGKAVKLDVPATVKNGNAMVPVQFIYQSEGANVEWDPGSRTVSITSADYSKTINNSNTISGITDSTVNVTTTNIDNSMSNSNNTTNNYDYSTNITNNITNNITVNMTTEEQIREILAKLIGTDFIRVEAQAANRPVNLDDIKVNLSNAPVIIPFDKQPSAVWNDGVLEYKEIINNDCLLAFTLPAGLGTGTEDRDKGLAYGFEKVIEVTDAYGQHLAKGGSVIEQMELDKGVAVVTLGEHLFGKIKEGETYKIRVYITKDGRHYSPYSNELSFTYKDNPEIHQIKTNEIRISSIMTAGNDRELFEAFPHPIAFTFVLAVDMGSRAHTFAWRQCSEAATKEFVLKAEGYPEVPAISSGFLMGDGNGMRYAVNLPQPGKLVKGVSYSLVPVNQNPEARWIVDEGVRYTAK